MTLHLKPDTAASQLARANRMLEASRAALASETRRPRQLVSGFRIDDDPQPVSTHSFNARMALQAAFSKPAKASAKVAGRKPAWQRIEIAWRIRPQGRRARLTFLPRRCNPYGMYMNVC